MKMVDVLKAAAIIGLVIGCFVGIAYGMGWIGVHYTETVGKAKKNAERKVFEQTQSYVEGKRQEATKLFKEWKRAEDISEKKSIESIVRMSFANFDETKLDEPLRSFVYNAKY